MIQSDPREAAQSPGGEPPEAADPSQDPLDEEFPDEPQNAWEAAQELLEHSPGVFFSGGSPAFGGSLVTGDQHAVSGGQVTGDVVQGNKTTTVVQVGAGFGRTTHHAGEIPRSRIDQLAAVFQEGPGFAEALQELRANRVVVLRGGHDTGRRCAALMLLHRLGITRIRALDGDAGTTSLRDQVSATAAPGYVLCDLVTSRTRQLRYEQLLSVGELLDRQDSHLVITVGESAVVSDVRTVSWRPPAPEDVLRATLRRHPEVDDPDQLLGLEPVRDFLGSAVRIREIAGFVDRLVSYAHGRLDLAALSGFSLAAVENQVREWLGDPQLELRDKAFLIALAVFDKAPYAVTAELCDRLYVLLQRVQSPQQPADIPVFGSSVTARMLLARAHGYQEDEATPWGPVPQRMAAFDNEHTARVLLREVWNGHPSARCSLVQWVRQLAGDGRPLVRTRAASAAATLAEADLPSAMALLISGWAGAQDHRRRLTAANALTLAYLAGTDAVPRILQEWCGSGQSTRRWTAIRAYGLLGWRLPRQALRDLAHIAAQRPTEAERDELVQAVELLLLTSGVRSSVLAEVVGWLQDDAPLRELALRAFLKAALRCECPDGTGASSATRPLMLDWFGQAAADPDSTDDRRLAALWRAALSDRVHTDRALEAVRFWVRSAEHDPQAEAYLAVLLPALAVTGADIQRLSHLLRAPFPDVRTPTRSGPPPAVAARLLSALTARG